jgi:gliding motility-associated-like protein
MGNHLVYIKDLNGCPISSQLVSVLGIPIFFTPNGDGYNDTWNVRGVSAFSESRLTVKIFDRYGKLLKQIAGIGEGWDGTYNGRNLPSDDYWFVITFEDGTITKGHFTLKR